MAIIEISPEYKVATAQVDAIRLREDNQLDTLYMLDTIEKNLTDISFLTVVSEGYPEFFQIGNLYVNRTRIQGIRELNNVYFILTTFGYLFEVGSIPYTIDEMLAFSGAGTGGPPGPGGPSLEEWDASIVSSGTVNIPVGAINGYLNTQVDGDFSVTYTGNDLLSPVVLTTASSASSSLTWIMPASNQSISCMLTNEEATLNDIWTTLLTNDLTGTVSYLFLFGTDLLGQYQTVVFGGTTGSGTLTDLPTLGGSITLSITEDATDHIISAGPTGLTQDTIASIPIATVSSLKPSLYQLYTAGGTTPPFVMQGNFGSSAGDAVRPASAVFGSSYYITGAGTYVGNVLNVGDIAQFVDVSPDSLFVFRPASTFVTPADIPALVQTELDNSGINTSLLPKAIDTYDSVAEWTYVLETNNATAISSAPYKVINVTNLADEGTQGANFIIDLNADINKDFFLEVVLNYTNISVPVYNVSSENNGFLNLPVLSYSLFSTLGAMDSKNYIISGIDRQILRISGGKITLLATRYWTGTHFSWDYTPPAYSVVVNTGSGYNVNCPYDDINTILILNTIGDIVIPTSMQDCTIHIDNSGESNVDLVISTNIGNTTAPLPLGSSSYLIKDNVLDIIPLPDISVIPKEISLGEWQVDLDSLAYRYPDKVISIRVNQIQSLQAGDTIQLTYSLEKPININFSTINDTTSEFIIQGKGKVLGSSVNNVTIDNKYTFHNISETQQIDIGDTTTHDLYINSNKILLDGTNQTVPLTMQLNGLSTIVTSFKEALVSYIGPSTVSILGEVLNTGEALIISDSNIRKITGYSPVTIPW